jgi:hypothetical protein
MLTQQAQPPSAQAADELPSVDEVLVLVSRSSAEYFFTFPEFEKVRARGWQQMCQKKL